ncbi:general secretion pathway protein GspK [Mesorhizobium intechi]|uniref:General secretion pathway protein GspK n=1 Tax=Mesorhizobium intechi TaxID=537601 RepID=A0A8T9AQQ0_9HYPH|nr:general secretion pathway protein GspK [Mesorhizobium intechi]TSE10949.1 general secretion pathway protein GspK [Mesorhizobium intechi]
MSDRAPHVSAGTSSRDESARSGFSLVAVLVFMLIVSAIVVPFAVTAKTRLMIANSEVEQERLSLLGEGLGNVVASTLTGASGRQKFALDSTPASCRSGGFSFTVRVQDHGGLIDLNAADDRLLELGFAALGFEQQTSAELAKAAIRFRDNAKPFADLPRSRSAVGPPEDKQAPFESVSELQEFSALASIPLRTLNGVFTVNSKRGTISIDRAPGRLRAALAGGSSASVVVASADASAYTVEVVVRRDGTGIVGEAGFIIEKSPTGAAFSRVSRSPAAEAGALPPAAGTADCEVLFGTEAAQILRAWSS